jgi:hypothetical protein
MLDPHFIAIGKTYVVRFGNRMQSVKIKERTGDSRRNFAWRGTICETGEQTRIRNIGRFVNEVPQDQVEGIPWMLTLSIVKEELQLPRLALKYSRMEIREQETYRLVASLPVIQIELFPVWADVIQNAVRLCRSGPKGSDIDHLHLFDPDEQLLYGISLELNFDDWDVEFASEEYCQTLFPKIETAFCHLARNPRVKDDDFKANPDGQGAVYWVAGDGVVSVLWMGQSFLKMLYLQDEGDITNFAKSLFGEHGHSIEVLRKLLGWHEGEWFDPPENFHTYRSYEMVEFDSVFIGALPLVHESSTEEGKKRYGRIVACEHKEFYPNISHWTEHRNKIWFRINKNTDDQDYTGPFENYLEAAQEAYLQFTG